MCGLKCELRGHQPVKSALQLGARLSHDHYDVASRIFCPIKTEIAPPNPPCASAIISSDHQKRNHQKYLLEK